MWLSSLLRDSIAAELRHMHRPEIADLVLTAEFTIVDRALLINPALLVGAEICSASNRAFFEHWICLAAMRTGIAIDNALILAHDDSRPWQVTYFFDRRLAERHTPLLLQR